MAALAVRYSKNKYLKARILFCAKARFHADFIFMWKAELLVQF